MKRVILVLSAFAVVVLPTIGRDAQENLVRTVWMNEDNQHFYDGRYHGDEDMTVEGCRALVDKYADTGVCTGILFCVNMQRALYDSDVWERFKDQPTDYSYQRHLRLLSERGVDQFKVWLERCRERGLSGWLTMRMNDCHGLEEVEKNIDLPDTTVKLWPSQLWRDHPEWRRAPYRQEHSWESAFDFSHWDVREHHLKLVREILSRWDMDGLELDWMRWGMYFAPGQEAQGRLQLTEFVKEVRRLADEAERRLGHAVRIGHRVPPVPEAALKAGFDVAAWADAGCVDRLTLAGFDNSTPNDIPVEFWRRLVAPQTGIICGIGYGGIEGAPYNKVKSPAVKRGCAASAWTCGADGLLLFNECYAEPHQMGDLAKLMRDISSPRELAKVGWRSVVGGDESYPGYPARRAFPVRLVQRFTGHAFDRMGHFVTLRLTTGEVPWNAPVKLTLAFGLGMTGDVVADLEVRVNARPIKLGRVFALDPKRVDQAKSWVKPPDYPRDATLVAEYVVPASCLEPRDNAIEVIPPLAHTVQRAAEPLPGELIWADLDIGTPDSTRVPAWNAADLQTTQTWFEENLYGRRPVERPAHLRFSPVGPDRVMVDGKAVRKIVRIEYAGPYGTNAFNLTAFIPRVERPAPAFLLICNRDPKENLDPERKVKSGFWPVEKIVGRGYAAMAFWNGDVAADETNGVRTGVFTCFEDQGVKRAPDAWGTISAWAWGASRVMDWIETEPLLDASHVAVVGHSRGGKASLWAGVTDSRFALACVNDSGCCGARLNRADIQGSERIADIVARFPHWFCGNLGCWAGRDLETTCDQHQLLALMAPRAVAVASATNDRWAGQRGEYASCVMASPAWEDRGLSGFISTGYPRPDEARQGGHISYHLRAGNHNLTPFDWNRYMDFADSFMKDQKAVETATLECTAGAEGESALGLSEG